MAVVTRPAVARWQLRAEFARRLSAMYGAEVPAYHQLVEMTQSVNANRLRADPAGSQRLGSLDRVSAERHGAIRVGTSAELEQVGRIFAALGMHPVGFYDLRAGGPTPIPVISTAFRPIEAAELARNPFRIFVSVLTSDDRRFFDADMQRRIDKFLASRQLFPRELIEIAGEAEDSDGLDPERAQRFLELAISSFALSSEPVDAGWYRELSRVSDVAADIAGVAATHVNHLTPRVLDIDELYRRMNDAGVPMIDQIQGPPRWDGPDVLLRQTSFRALDEVRPMREADGTIRRGTLRVRFGEVEARGIALTNAGRDLVAELGRELDARTVEADVRTVEADARAVDAGDHASRPDLAAKLWQERFPRDERQLLSTGLAFFTFESDPWATNAPLQSQSPPTLDDVLTSGRLKAMPIVYEDFLPRSAAGIFGSNLTAPGTSDDTRAGSHRDLEWLAGVLGRAVYTPESLYQQQHENSLNAALTRLGITQLATQQRSSKAARYR